MVSDTYLLVSGGFSIFVSVVCIAVLYMLRSGVEQKNLSLAFSALLVFHIGFFIAFVVDRSVPGSAGMELQYCAGILILFVMLSVLSAEYSVTVPRWILISLGVLACALMLIVLLADKSPDYPLFIACGSSCVLFLAAQCYVLAKKLSRVSLSSSRRNALLLFALLFVPQIVLSVHLWVPAARYSIYTVPLLLSVSQIAITVFAMRNHFVPLCDLRYQAIVDAIDEPLFVIDMSSSVVAANESACRLFPECREVTERDVPVPLPHLLESVLSDFRNNIQHESTRYVYVNWNVFEPSVRTILHEHQVYGYSLRLRDVTEFHNSYLKLSASNTRLQRDIENSQAVIDTIRSKAVSGAIQFLRDRDETSGDHMRRSSNYTYLLANQMRQDGLYRDVLTDEYVDTLVQVAPLHDVGKFFVAEEILKKPDELTPQEYEAVKSHVAMGAQMVDRMVVNNADDIYYQLAKEVTLYHHERWDGTGYLSGLKGTAIPLSARIVAVSTVFDLVSTNRPYRAAFSFEQAFDTIVSLSGTQFDPDIVASFKNARNQFYAAYTQMVKLS